MDMAVLALVNEAIETAASIYATTPIIAGITAFAAIGVLIAVFPRHANHLRERLPGQLEGPDWYIRALGVVVATIAIGLGLAVLIAS
jgi:uncharacterized membrane protein YbjE (DUF340 family)